MFCRPFLKTLLLWLAFANPAAASAAAEVKSAESAEPLYHATRWTAEDGLPQMRISALAQTPDGYLWAGTWFGLARFDGVRFVVFNSANTPELKKEAITALAVDRGDGALWIGTTEGVLRLKDRQLTRLTDPHELSNSVIAELVPAAGGGIWIWTQDAIVLWRGRLVSAFPLHLGAGEERHSAWETEDEHLIVSTSLRCLELAEDGKVKEWRLPAGAPADSWLAGVRATERARQVWLGTQHGLFHFADGRWQELQTFAPRLQPCDHFLADRAGCVWAACDKAGLFRCAASQTQPITLDERGAEKSINCLLQDQEGFIWIGTDTGLYQLKARLLRAFSVAEGLPHRECWSVCEAPDGAIWVGTAGGLGRIKDGQAQTIPGAPPRVGSLVLVDRDNAVWLADAGKGLIAWQPGGETNRFWNSPTAGTAMGVSVEALYLDGSGRVWAGTSHGVTWFEHGQPAARWGERGLPTNSVRAIYETRDGTIWFGTWQGGAVRWKVSGSQSTGSASPSQRFTMVDGLADNRVFVFHEDTEGALWIGTHNGLSRFKDGKFFTFRTGQGLFDNLINWLEEDDSGRLWFSCNRGIFRMDRAELNAVAEGRKPAATATVYGVADGMLTPETNGEHQPAGCKARDGRLWFATADGVVVVDPRVIEDHGRPPPAVIEQVVADEEKIFGDGPLSAIVGGESPFRLGPGRARLLQFRYTASSFADPKHARFRCRLSPHDPDWREETTERVAYYTDLRPGNYRFEVKAASARGTWNETPAMFAFSLAPKFTETVWFPLSCALALLTVTGGIVEWRLRWQRRAFLAEKNTAVERERGRIARDLHDDLGASVTGLALQLEAARSRGQAAGEQLGELAGEARDIAQALRELSWATNPRCDNVGSLGVFLGEMTERFCAAADLECQLVLPPAENALPVATRLRHDLLVLVKEILANVAKHAGARSVKLNLSEANSRLHLTVSDDGVGFDAAKAFAGSGLRNLRERLEKAGGSFTVSSSPEQGTNIAATLPLRVPKES